MTQLLAIRPVVSYEVLVLWLCRTEFPQGWEVMNKGILGGKRAVCVDRHMGRLRESCTLVAV